MVTKLQAEIQAIADDVDINYIDKKLISNSDSDSEETLVDEIEAPILEAPILEAPIRVKRKYTRRVPKETIKTSDENVEIRLSTRKRGPQKRVVTVYKEDLPVQPIQIIEKVKRKAGRPKSKPVVEIIKEIDEPDVIAFEKPTNVKMSARQLKKIELEVRLLELQAVSGNSNLKINKKGKVDGRQSKVRTQKQLDATARLVESNKLRRLRKKDELKMELMGEQQAVVKNIIGALKTNQIKKTEQKDEEANLKLEKDKIRAEKKKSKMALFD